MVYAVITCLSDCHKSCILLKQLNTGQREQHHTIAQGQQFSDAEDLGKTQTGSPPTEVPNGGGVDK